MARPALSLDQLQRTTYAIIIVTAVLALLILGKGFLIPIVLAFLISSLLTNSILRLESKGFPSWLATTCSLLIGIVALILIGLIFQSQTSQLEQALPQYTQRLQTIMSELTAKTGTTFMARIETSVSTFDYANLASSMASSASGIFGDIAMVMLYTGFLLAERGTLKQKFAFLVPNKQDNTELNELTETVSLGIRRYLSIKTVVSASTGIMTYVVLKFYGVHFSESSGLLAFLFNFIPVVGSAIAVLIPVVLALMQFDTVAPALQIAALLMGVQFMVGNVIEPKMMGKTLNLSPFVIIVALTFWTIIWGFSGAFLSVPITASAVIIFRNIQPLRWIAILLSADGKPEVKDEPVGPKFQFQWPFHKSESDDTEIKALKAELETMKADQAKKETTPATAASTEEQTSSKKTRKPRPKTTSKKNGKTSNKAGNK